MVIKDRRRTMDMMAATAEEDPGGKHAETKRHPAHAGASKGGGRVLWEATRLVDDSRKHFDEIEAFVQDLGPAAGVVSAR